MGNLRVWKYEQADVRDDVRTGLPHGWHLFIYKITAGEEEGVKYSGKPWYTSLLINHETKQQIEFCTCPEGTFRSPLAVLGAVKDLCKHTENLKAFLLQKEKRK
jgi:hypothetical protein